MRAVAVAAALLLAVAGSAGGQVRSGLNELGLSGNLNVTTDGDESLTVMQLQLRYGRFITRQVEIGPTLSVIKFEEEDAVGSIGGFGALHFGAEGATTVPYVGAALEAGFGEEEDNPFSYGGFAGLKVFVGQAGAISTEAYLSRITEGDFDLTNYGLRVGVSLFL